MNPLPPTLKEWLYTECDQSEVKGDVHEGFYLGIDTINAKLLVAKLHYNCMVHYTGFTHFLFTKPDKSVWASGSLTMEIVSTDSMNNPINDKLVGASTFNLETYDNDKDRNPHYAATLKSLCKANALLEYPQFGSRLNRMELVKTIPIQRAPDKSSSKAINAVNSALK